MASAVLMVLETFDARSSYDLRVVGASKAFFLVVAVLWLSWRLHRSPAASFVHSLIVLMVISDPLNTLYLNTLYTEFSAVLGCYLALAGLAVLMLERRLTYGTGAIFLLGLLVLLTSKFQHLALPWLVLAAACWATRTFVPRAAMLCMAGVLTIGTLWQFNNLEHAHSSIHQANAYNAAFQTFLPDLPDSAFGSLGLDAKCRALVGTSWFQRRGHSIEARCPQALSIDRVALMGQIVRHPLVALKVVSRSFFQSSSWRVGYLGEVENGSGDRLDVTDGVMHISLADGVSRLSYPAYVLILLAPVVYVLMMLSIGMSRRSRDSEGELGAASAILVLSVACAGLVWCVALLGDGYSDLAKHLHLAFNLIVVAWILMFSHALVLFRTNRVTRSQRTRIVVAFIVAAGTSVAFASTRPAAIGTLDAPAVVVETGASVRLTGWVKDPFGVLHVQARYGTRTTLGQLTAAAPDVDAMFPIAAAHPGRRFQVDVETPDEPGVFRVEVFAVDSLGTETRIDSIALDVTDPD